MEKLQIADKSFSSRLFVGTGKFSSSALMSEAVRASGSELVTVALKRVELENPQDDILSHLDTGRVGLLPNTSGVRNAREAVFAAQLAREALGTNWMKLEIHPDPRYLFPDPVETLKAAEELVKDGFVVMPYVHADPVLCRRLVSAVIIFMSYSAVMSILWFLLESPDLAITEAAVGAGVTSLLFFFTLRKINALKGMERDEE